MKIEEKEKGEISIKVDNIDDLWYLSNIISPGDTVFGFVFRKDTQSAEMKRAKKVERKKIRVGIEVKKLEFQDYSDRLRIQGIIVHGPEDYIGTHQSINVGLGDEISIMKEWREEEIKLLKEAVANSEKPMIYFLAIEYGAATIAVLRSYGIQELANVRKRGDEDEEFFGEEATRHMREIDRRVLKGETVNEEDSKIISGVLHILQYEIISIHIIAALFNYFVDNKF